MPRSVNHVASRARRKKILKRVKGQFGARKNVWTVAKNAYEKRINAAARLEGMSYSQLMGAIHKAGIEINRKTLANLAMNNPEAFKAIVDKVK